MMNQNECQDLVVLDCTFRDGGYYNNWDYSTELANRYLQVMSASGIDYVELGFRALESSAFEGPYAYTPDSWIKRLDVPRDLKIGVMCNAKDLLKYGNPKETVSQLFCKAEDSPVTLVRVAAHFNEVDNCGEIMEELHKLGYVTGFNLMQSSGRSRDELIKKAEIAATWPIDSLYFADSLGNMLPDDISFIVSALREAWKGPMGFHAHDNMGMGLVNALAAIKEGVTWIDGTVTGMGRGAGNVRMEYLLLELSKQGMRETELDALMSLVIEEFEPVQRECGWGPSIYYHLSATYGVHPTYVQEMLSDERYKPVAIVKALKRLGAAGASGFSRDRLKDVTESEPLVSVGTWDATGWLEGRDVLLVGPGEEVKNHLEALEYFIEKKKPYVICININPWIPSHLIDSWAACNPDRLMLDKDFYAKNQGLLLAPNALLQYVDKDTWNHWTIQDYGVSVESGELKVMAENATIPHALSAIYAIAAVNAGGASNLYLAGFDGYTSEDPRHKQMENALGLYNEQPGVLPLTSITPTSLSIATVSPFSEAVYQGVEKEIFAQRMSA
ncbi:aldolase catalytic domain-containing protein [Vreelandella nigrificans]|nr:aldolase catalytic domain-containing protein [Halomonas nigrificans]